MKKYLLTLIILLTVAFTAEAQEFRKADPVICPADPQSYDTFVAPRQAFKNYNSRSAKAVNSNIVVNYNGFTDEARVAFQYAVDIWSVLLKSPTTIVVNANFSDLGNGVLGSAGPTNFVRDFDGAPIDTTFYPIPLAEKLAGHTLNKEGEADINANFSNTFDFYFGLDGSPPANQYDFVSIVLHELGHGLGFSGFVTFDDTATPNTASWDIGTTNKSSIYTKYAQLGDGTLITDLPTTGVENAEAFTSNDLFFNGMVSNSALGGNPKLFAPSPWNGGSSFSHLDEATYAPGDPNSLMSPQFGAGEAIHDPGITLELFADMGWVHTYLVHENTNQITANISDPFVINLEIQSDTTLKTSVPVLYYTTTDFTNATAVNMTASANTYTAQIPNPGSSGMIKYYIGGVEDILNRQYTSPANAPRIYYTINIINASKRTLPYLATNGGNFELNASDFSSVALNGTTNVWERGVPSNVLNTAPSGENVWKTSLNRNIEKANVSYSSALVSPVFDFSNDQQNHELSFKFSMENAYTEAIGVFGSGPFGFNVQYTSDDGSSWLLLGKQNDPRGDNWYNVNDADNLVFPTTDASGWIKQTIEVNNSDTTFIAETALYNVSFLTGNDNVQFRIVFYVAQDFNDAGYEADGLLIDDFEIKTTDPTADFITTSAGITYAGTSVDFEYISAGANSYLWDFGDGSTSTLENPSHTYETGGAFDVSLTIQSAAGEQVSLQESLINIIPTVNGAYKLADGGDLENNAADFNILNVAGTGFQIGNSTIAGKQGTASGATAIVTGITDDTYQNDSEAYIYTPEFKFDEVGFYELSFETNYQFEAEWDGFIVEYTLNRGTSWIKLDDALDAENWYNQISNAASIFGAEVPIFSGNTSGNFEKKKTDITFLQGAGNVGFRIKFLTDAAEVDAGMAFDNFEITYSAPQPVVAAFTASILETCTNEGVNFVNDSEGSVGSVLWAFGQGADPSTSEDLNPTGIRYTSSGLKNVTLTITDFFGEKIVLEKLALIKVGDLHDPSFTEGELNSDLAVLLTATEGDIYQWLFNGDTIPSATERTYLAIDGGTYTVAVAINGCIQESSTQNVVTANKSELESTFAIFPNPISEQHMLNYSFTNEYMGDYQVFIYNVAGKLMISESLQKVEKTVENTLDTKGYKNGLYIIQIQAGGNMTQNKFMITK